MRLLQNCLGENCAASVGANLVFALTKNATFFRGEHEVRPYTFNFATASLLQNL